MSYNRVQLQDLIERSLDWPVGLGGHKATHLLLGTAAVESAFGHYLRQMNGPALGAFQMEPATFDWLRSKYSARVPEIATRVAGEVEFDLRLAIVMARLRYLADPQPMPSDLPGWAHYWKRVYNTSAGKGTPEKFIEAYRRYVL